MEILQFLIGDEQRPVYRTVTPEESEVLRALLGRGFRFHLDEGEPLDDLIFDVLGTVSMRSDFYLTPPPEAAVLGTFELRDITLPPGAETVSGRRFTLRPRTH